MEKILTKRKKININITIISNMKKYKKILKKMNNKIKIIKNIMQLIFKNSFKIKIQNTNRISYKIKIKMKKNKINKFNKYKDNKLI
jgi:hypothetical protein